MVGCKCTTVSEILETKDPAFYAAIQQGLDKANTHALSNSQKVSHYYYKLHIEHLEVSANNKLCVPNVNVSLTDYVFCRSRNLLYYLKIFPSLEENLVS